MKNKGTQEDWYTYGIKLDKLPKDRPTPEQAFAHAMGIAGFKDWYESRPENVRAVVRGTPPGIYLINYEGKTRGYPGPLISYGEEEGGTVTLTVQVDSPIMQRQVFGLKPESLILIALVGAGEENETMQ